MKKTRRMLLLERMNSGKDILTILRETCHASATPEMAASELSISVQTLRNWRRQFGVSAPWEYESGDFAEAKAAR